jgi:serine phosphatase RsbU (regulator of sigma subunit)
MGGESDSQTMTSKSAKGRARCACVAEVMSRFCFRRFSRLCTEMGLFANSIETSIFPIAQQHDREELIIRIHPAGDDWAMSCEAGDDADQCWTLHALARFLHDVGVDTIVMDTELESNQVSDVLEMLWHIRHYLKGEKIGIVARLLGRDKIHDSLVSGKGFHMACADVGIDVESRTLTIRNSYCQLLFSKAVTAYKQRVSGFKDHRAFFRAAPKYAFLTALCIALPEILLILFGWPQIILLVITPVVAVLVGFATYVVFQTIAAEEYDKEHQAKELSRRHQTLTRVYNKIRMDLNTARTIQQAMMPDADFQPMPEKVKLVRSFIPEMEVGGDYYDFKRLDADRLAILMADVSGHGMSAAFITGLIKTTFEYGNTADTSVGEFLSELNNVLERLTPDASFAAVIYGVYNIKTRTLTYANAGHSPMPMVLRDHGANLEVLDEPINLLAGVEPDTEYEEGAVRLDVGDRLIICTDGVPDSVDAEGERLKIPRMEAVIRENASASADILLNHMLDAVREHTGDAAQSDDQTLLIMEVIE